MEKVESVMIELYPEFYNDVFGPIIQPVSSSHMAAPSKKLSAPCMRILVSVGWPCDPIPGGKDMPCMARVLYVADTIGRGLSGDLLCTARGGHCAAPTAKKLACDFREWHSRQ